MIPLTETAAAVTREYDDSELQRLRLDPDLLRLLLAEGEHVEVPGVSVERDTSRADEEHGNAHDSPFDLPIEVAHQPEDNRLKILSSYRHQEGHKRPQKGADHHSGQDEGLSLNPAPAPGQPQHYGHRTGPGAKGENGLARSPRNVPEMKNDRGTRAEGRSRRHPDQIGVGQRVHEEALKRAACHRQRATHRRPQGDSRQPQVPEDVSELGLVHERPAGQVATGGVDDDGKRHWFGPYIRGDQDGDAKQSPEPAREQGYARWQWSSSLSSPCSRHSLILASSSSISR
jgi:hypothetical protein